jgi:hypothetical protein
VSLKTFGKSGDSPGKCIYSRYNELKVPTIHPWTIVVVLQLSVGLFHGMKSLRIIVTRNYKFEVPVVKNIYLAWEVFYEVGGNRRAI